MSKPTLKLDWCSHAAAKYAVEKWHYSGSLPVGKLVKVGAWEDGKYIGCVLFAYGANNNIGKPFGVKQTEVCELVRVALTSHATPVTRITAIALRMLIKLCPGIRLVVSYADTREGHIGGIYQAGNWVFVGTSPGATEYLFDGKWCHSMQIQTFVRGGKLTGRKGLKTRQAGAKHKYLMPLDDEMRKRVEPLRRPYPKRAGGVAGDTSANHAGEGGSIPTPALSSDSVGNG